MEAACREAGIHRMVAKTSAPSPGNLHIRVLSPCCQDSDSDMIRISTDR